jgi:predicted metal-dependent hydrolase
VKAELKFLAGYPAATLDQVRNLLAQEKLGELLRKKYRTLHEVRTDRALYDYVNALRLEHLRGGEPVNKVLFDSKLQIITQALGTHTTVSRVQGNKLLAKREIRVASLFKEVPIEFLRMIAVHELAHTKEREHDKAFYRLCTYMEPQYHQYEFDLRLYLTHLDSVGPLNWNISSPASAVLLGCTRA